MIENGNNMNSCKLRRAGHTQNSVNEYVQGTMVPMTTLKGSQAFMFEIIEKRGVKYGASLVITFFGEKTK